MRVQLRGGVGADEADCARGLLAGVVTHHGIDASAVRVRLAGAACGDGPTLVQVNLNVGAIPARIQVAGRGAATVIAAAAARLHQQIGRLTGGWRPWPWPDPHRRTLGVPGPGEVSRVKAVRLVVGVPSLAVAVLDAMDYHVHLFTDADTGEDAIVYRAGDTGLRLARQHRMHPPGTPRGMAITVNSRRVPTLSTAQAADRLAAGWLPFIFFTDPDTGRGNVVYRRYDGDLTLITPRAPHLAARHHEQ